MTPARFTYTVVASSLHDPLAVDAIVAPITTLADTLGGRRNDAPDGSQVGGAQDEAERSPEPAVEIPDLFIVATGGTEQAILDLVARRRVTHADTPTVLIAHPAHNSLPASLEALAALQQTHRRGRVVYLAGDSGPTSGDSRVPDRIALDEAVADLEAILRFRTARLGVVGGPSSWLVASSPDAEVVHRRWGPQVEVVDPARMIELTRTPVVPTGPLAERFATGASPSDDATHVSVDRVAVEAAARVGAALDDVVDGKRLDAVTVRCFDLLGDPGTSGCLALASLNDEGIVAGCEGDLPSTLGMMWVRHLLGQTSWMANPAQVDRAGNRLVLAHCTVAPSLTEHYSLSTHFESGIGVGISGHFAEQQVTLLRVGGRDLERCWIAEGAIVESGDDPDLCRTQVTIELSDGSVDDLLDHPLGNHIVMASGHHGERLRRWWRMAIAD